MFERLRLGDGRRTCWMHPGATARYREDDFSGARPASSGWPEGRGRRLLRPLRCGHRHRCCFSLSQRTVAWRPCSRASDCPGHAQMADLVHLNSALDASVLLYVPVYLCMMPSLCTGLSGLGDILGKGQAAAAGLCSRRCSAISPACRTTIWSAQQHPTFKRAPRT